MLRSRDGQVRKFGIRHMWKSRWLSKGDSQKKGVCQRWKRPPEAEERISWLLFFPAAKLEIQLKISLGPILLRLYNISSVRLFWRPRFTQNLGFSGDASRGAWCNKWLMLLSAEASPPLKSAKCLKEQQISSLPKAGGNLDQMQGGGNKR